MGEYRNIPGGFCYGNGGGASGFLVVGDGLFFPDVFGLRG
jgi:hypothetical protein